ncbi:hypothetical protein [Gelidibacter gilvus]|uniref:Apea-like HEPN domain-containing protein n=1 Tax=Gelidibacter gilvus TaxID=59602 RepID=A0A4Q0XHT1_9FLAO|nr:hypothetical protein [Gelidibacter gilvus]RXJ49559.1 hypothetical protein ESZ48_11130 [Gelidibacter gilvus]
MQNVTIRYSVNAFEQIFIEKGLELLFKNTIDSFRLRLHNPKTLLQELIAVCQSSISGVLTNNDYADSTSKELKKTIDDDDDGLIFNKVSKKHYLKIITKLQRKDYNLAIQSSSLILKENSDYSHNLFNSIIELTSSFNTISDDGTSQYQENLNNVKKKIIVLLSHLLVEMINKGYSKKYLYNFFQTTFVRNVSHTAHFEDRVDIFKTLLDKEDEEFTIIYLIQGNSFRFSEFKKIDNNYGKVNKRFRGALKDVISTKAYTFLEQHKENNLLYVKLVSKDYFRAIELSLEKISKDLDIYHLGFNDHFVKIGSQCCVIGENQPLKASTFPSNFYIDGFTRSNTQIFEILLEKIKKISQNNVDKDSYDKIISAIRYYRTGSESPELETKLLNYWIGLEYIFTSYNTDQKTIDRIRNYFPICHSVVYVKRNLYDFHKSLERLNISSSIANYDSSLDYFKEHSTYTTAYDNSTNQLLKFRTRYFQKWFEEPNKIDFALKRHSDNLYWNLTRLYRIRNEIVHNAAIKNGIYIHISHMKYYLSFILNSILDFMADEPADINNDGKVTIEDYFITQEIIFGSLKGEKLEEFMKIDNPNQVFY